ncbi:MAG: acetyl-CoA carboxylase biotin carboxyl carrier protein subunit [Planctomycetota bacterium]|nr:MAG: acetyl-CoA carboxylase biotin carboxyl carrier protein subunit [Planctomycetota bacterium]
MPQVELKSEITGTVWMVPAKAGERMKAGEEVLILESMKMEFPLEAPGDGVVEEIRVKPGDSVQEGDVVAIFRTDE